MRISYRLFPISLLIAAMMIIMLQAGCTRSGITGRTTADVDQIEPAPEPISVQEETQEEIPDEIYDLEDEALEDDEIDDQIEEVRLSGRTAADSFSVKDVSDAVIDASAFDTGYRIQIFASSDLEKAKELKKNFMAGTGLAVYIEFEDGMYKVRVGDFLKRDDASQARNMLVEEYPDCWIVSTTVRK
ncbi:MAG: SPOR domain-containing protein [Candidatus Krumholzibacteriota bacterium]|nr:SPOR domain-containing protein [Candidatus Krumholzibacteriota bacterium]